MAEVRSDMTVNTAEEKRRSNAVKVLDRES